jgi:hypothetical protein
MHGTIVEMCAHIDGRDWCKATASHFDYGMARCASHEIDLSPCVWDGNLNEDGFCVIDHVKRSHIYGAQCRNPRKSD